MASQRASRSDRFRSLASGLSIALALVIAASCSPSAKDTGGLMLVIARDGPLPLDRLQLSVASEGEVLSSATYRVPEEVDLPATLGIVSNGDKTASVEITVTGWNGETALDRRDAIVTQVPTDRVAMVTIVLSARCTSKVEVVAGEVISTCEGGETCAPETGACQSVEVDAAELPTYNAGAEDGIGVGAASGGGAGNKAGASSGGNGTSGNGSGGGSGGGGSSAVAGGGMTNQGGEGPVGDGSCDPGCAASETCALGVCIGEDGCGGPARNLALSELSVYQSVKIPVMVAGSAVAQGARVADLVQGRETLFRAFLTPGPDWVSRELAARLMVKNGAATEVYNAAKQTISSPSSDADPASTFQVAVPGAEMGPDTTFWFEVVECGEPAGTVDAPRFPATGETELGARLVGSLKLHFVPVQFNSRTPDTTPATIALYRDYLEALYPVSSVETSVGGTMLTAAAPLDLPDVLNQVRDLRTTEAPAADTYYFGLFNPTATRQQFCASGCNVGLAFAAGPTQSSARAAIGAVWGDEASAQTIAHELGHNHGRQHAPCPAGTTAVDAQFPYVNGSVGAWGYDRRAMIFLDPANRTDIMGFCASPWLSDYTYQAILTRVAAVNGH